MKKFIYIFFLLFLFSAERIEASCQFALSRQADHNDRYPTFTMGQLTLSVTGCQPTRPGNTIQYTWHVDETVAGSSSSLSFTPPHPGFFNIQVRVAESGDCEGGCIWDLYGGDYGFGRKPAKPTLESQTSCEVISKNYGTRTVNFSISATDPDLPGEPITGDFEILTQVTEGGQVTGTQGGPHYQHQFSATNKGSFIVTYRARNSYDVKNNHLPMYLDGPQDSFSIQCPNSPPEIGNITPEKTTTFSRNLKTSVVDPDIETNLRYRWIIEEAPTGANVVLQNASGTLTQQVRTADLETNFTTDGFGDYLLRLEVEDTNGLIDSKSVFFSVSEYEIEKVDIGQTIINPDYNANGAPEIIYQKSFALIVKLKSGSGPDEEVNNKFFDVQFEVGGQEFSFDSLQADSNGELVVWINGEEFEPEYSGVQLSRLKVKKLDSNKEKESYSHVEVVGGHSMKVSLYVRDGVSTGSIPQITTSLKDFYSQIFPINDLQVSSFSWFSWKWGSDVNPILEDTLIWLGNLQIFPLDACSQDQIVTVAPLEYFSSRGMGIMLTRYRRLNVSTVLYDEERTAGLAAHGYGFHSGLNPSSNIAASGYVPNPSNIWAPGQSRIERQRNFMDFEMADGTQPENQVWVSREQYLKYLRDLHGSGELHRWNYFTGKVLSISGSLRLAETAYQWHIAKILGGSCGRRVVRGAGNVVIRLLNSKKQVVDEQYEMIESDELKFLKLDEGEVPFTLQLADKPDILTVDFVKDGSVISSEPIPYFLMKTGITNLSDSAFTGNVAEIRQEMLNDVESIRGFLKQSKWQSSKSAIIALRQKILSNTISTGTVFPYEFTREALLDAVAESVGKVDRSIEIEGGPQLFEISTDKNDYKLGERAKVAIRVRRPLMDTSLEYFVEGKLNGVAIKTDRVNDRFFRAETPGLATGNHVFEIVVHSQDKRTAEFIQSTIENYRNEIFQNSKLLEKETYPGERDRLIQRNELLTKELVTLRDRLAGARKLLSVAYSKEFTVGE